MVQRNAGASRTYKLLPWLLHEGASVGLFRPAHISCGGGEAAPLVARARGQPALPLRPYKRVPSIEGEKHPFGPQNGRVKGNKSSILKYLSRFCGKGCSDYR